MTTEKKMITVKMSERSPIRIDPEVWDLIASAERHDGAVKVQANHEWYIRVREHSDGRRIVYGAYEAGPGGVHVGFRESRGGFLIEASHVSGNGPDAGKSMPDEEGTIRAIRRIAGIIGDEKMGDECIADLPAEEI